MSELKTVRCSDVKHEPVSWLWPGRIARGKVTLLAGDPGLGKSFVTCDIAARCTLPGGSGGDWPDATTPLQAPGDVLFLNAEDDWGDTIRPRLEAAGADLSRVHLVEGVDRPSGKRLDMVTLDRDIDAIKRALKQCARPRLVVIDPISAFMGGADANSNAEVRAVLADLSRMAAITGSAVLCVTHLNKSGMNQQQGKIVYRTMGSLAFTAAARMVWYVCALHGDQRVRAMTLVKSNLKTDAKGASFQIEDGKVNWLETNLAMTADQADNWKMPDTDDQASSTREAVDFLRSLLKDNNDAIEAGRAIKLALEAGISMASIKRAKKLARIVARRSSSGGPERPWLWAVAKPGEDVKDDEGPMLI